MTFPKPPYVEWLVAEGFYEFQEISMRKLEGS